MAQRYFLQLSYNGKCYHGWQVQPNAISVQEVMEKALSTLLRNEIAIVGAGRTDTGVHASFFMLHFDTDNEILDFDKFLYKLNRFLPADIAVQKLWKVKPDTHARFSAVSRTYHYYISTEKNPFAQDISCLYTGNLNIDRMNEAANVLLGYTDFTSFSRLHTDVKTNNCKVIEAYWKQEEKRLVFVIRADRFLRNMVRAIVGTLLDVGKGKLSVGRFREIIEQKDRGVAGASAPAEGLFLVDIEYSDDFFTKE